MITVLISTYERPDQLVTCLHTLLDGTEPPEEILVVDQSRDDATRQVVEAAGSDLIRYTHHSPPSISGARNRGFELARGDYVAIVDDDCEMPPEWARGVREELGRYHEPDALFGDIRDADPDPTGKQVPVSMYTAERPSEWTQPVNPCRLGFGAHMIVRREAFLALGGFDPRLGPGAELLGAEDVDLAYRLLKSGRRAVSTPAIWVLHRPRERSPRFFFGRNYGFAAFCAKHLRQGDRYPWRMVATQARNDLKMLASAVRRRSWFKAQTSYWMTTGTWRGLVRGWRAYRPTARGS